MQSMKWISSGFRMGVVRGVVRMMHWMRSPWDSYGVRIYAQHGINTNAPAGPYQDDPQQFEPQPDSVKPVHRYMPLALAYGPEVMQSVLTLPNRVCPSVRFGAIAFTSRRLSKGFP